MAVPPGAQREPSRNLGCKLTGAWLYPVPDDPNVPYPVDMARVEATLANMPDVVELRREGGSLRIHVGPGREDELVAAFSLDGQHLSVRTVWQSGLVAGTLKRRLLVATDHWNRENYFPTVYVIQTPSAELRLVADYVVVCHAGLSDRQLEENLQMALACCLEAVEFCRWATRKLMDT